MFNTSKHTGPQDNAARVPLPAFTARRHDSLASVEPLWRLFETEGLATAFQHFAWVRTMQADLAPPGGARPFVVEVRQAPSGTPVMLIPFLITEKPTHRVVEYFGLGVSDISAPLLAPGYLFPDGAGPALWEAIVAVLPEADLVHIDQINARIGGHVNPLAMLPGALPVAMRSFDVGIDGDPDTVVARIANRQTRGILKTSARRLAERGTVRFLVATTRDDLDALLPVMISQRLERFRALGRFDLLTAPHMQAFYRHAAIASLDGRGPVRVFGLSVDGEWVATAYGLVHAGTFHLTVITMAGGTWCACSPGMATFAHAIRWARQAGIDTVDFSVGDIAYKAGFGACANQLYAVTAALTARGRLTVLIQRSRAGLKERIRARPWLFNRLRSALQFYRRKLQGRTGLPCMLSGLASTDRFRGHFDLVEATMRVL